MEKEWKARLLAQNQNRNPSPRADYFFDAKAFQGSRLCLYSGLAKAESSALCQARTEKIGLRAFLYRCKVPEINTPTCPCGLGDQTAAHLFSECTNTRSQNLRALGYGSAAEVHHGLSHYKTAPGMARALAYSGWLPQFKVFNELRHVDTIPLIRTHAWSRRLPPPS